MFVLLAETLRETLARNFVRKRARVSRKVLKACTRRFSDQQHQRANHALLSEESAFLLGQKIEGKPATVTRMQASGQQKAKGRQPGTKKC